MFVYAGSSAKSALSSPAVVPAAARRVAVVGDLARRDVAADAGDRRRAGDEAAAHEKLPAVEVRVAHEPGPQSRRRPALHLHAREVLAVGIDDIDLAGPRRRRSASRPPTSWAASRSPQDRR